MSNNLANINYLPSSRGKGAFCCTDGAIKVGCSLGGSKPIREG